MLVYPTMSSSEATPVVNAIAWELQFAIDVTATSAKVVKLIYPATRQRTTLN